jgi:MarR family transcriptional regulator, transcriptional regulator for hemolysin
MASAEPELGAPPRQTTEALLMATSRALRRAYDNRLAGIGLKLSEAYLLGHVHTHGPMTQTQLAEWLGIGRAATGTLIDTLEDKGLVARSAHPADRRVWLVASTQRAAPLVEEIIAVDTALREQLWTGVSPAERRALSETLQRIQSNLAALPDDQN